MEKIPKISKLTVRIKEAIANRIISYPREIVACGDNFPVTAGHVWFREEGGKNEVCRQ